MTKTKNEKGTSLKKERAKLFFLTVGGFLASVLPLCVLFCVKWETYVTSVPGGAVRLSLGGGLIAVLMLLKVLGKIKLPSRLCVMAISLVFVYLLEAVLSDLSLILWVAIAGEAVDAFLFSPFASRVRERIKLAKQADATADRVEEMLKSYIGGRNAV
ncbi:MAG: hypothetical protein E7643_01450 [Ruminococcaceae bacterium]|nr:hypothetical protein [Oscillospiraceae bacterium]